MLDMSLALKTVNDIMRLLVPLALELKALADDGNSEERAAIEDEGASEIEAALALMLAAVIAVMRGADAAAVGVAAGALSVVDRHTPKLQAAVQRMLGEAVALGVQTAEIQAGVAIGIDWELINQDALAWARRYSYELVRDLDDTTRGVLRREIAAWIEAGEALPDLEARLASTFGESRARQISSTEVTRAYAEGQRQGLRASGLVSTYTWHTAADDIVCPICSPKNGQTYSLDGEMPPAHVACRCWITPIFQGGE